MRRERGDGRWEMGGETGDGMHGRQETGGETGVGRQKTGDRKHEM